MTSHLYYKWSQIDRGRNRGKKNMQEKLNGTYYLFDCLDGVIGDRLLTLQELRQAMTWENVTYTEKDAKRIAMDYEATLYRYKYIDGEVKESKTLYDPWQIFD